MNNENTVKHLDLFSGIGGFALAAEWVWPNIEHTFCDIEPFSQEVLKKHWPTATIYGDIHALEGQPADIVTGGFPCQPFSSAGFRRGTEDDRHLWPEMLRVIRASSPRWVVGENVGGLLTWNDGMVLDQVCTDLEAEGYEVWPFVLPAAGVGAPHRRDRVWIVAHSTRNGSGGAARAVPRPHELETQSRPPQRDAKLLNASLGHLGEDASANSRSIGRQGWEIDGPQGTQQPGSQQLAGLLQFDIRAALSDAGNYRASHGVSNRLDKSRNKGLGNAIVPQVAEQIFVAIKACDPSLA
jgi:DNA (cytosine-5)-methyltransferase 1